MTDSFRVLIFEPSSYGHRLTYVKHIATALAALPVEVVLALGREAPRTDEYAAQIASLEDRVTIDASIAFPRGLAPMRVAKAKFAALRAAVSRHRPNHLCVPYADALSQVIGLHRWQGRRAWPQDVTAEALIMRGDYAYDPAPSLVNRLRYRVRIMALAAAPWQTLYHIDPIVYDYLRRHCRALRGRMRLAPDPIEPMPAMTTAQARRFLQVPEDGRYLVCSGQLDQRKGADLLIRAFARAKLGPADRLLLVGKMNDVVRTALEEDGAALRRTGRLITFDRYVSDEELSAANVAADVVVTPYPRHIGSASILIRAAAAGKRVLGSDFGWIKWAIETFDFGEACPVRDLEVFAAALPGNLDAAPDYQHNEAARRFVAFHSIANAQATWTAPVCQRLGREPEHAPPDWEHVMAAVDRGTGIVKAKGRAPRTASAASRPCGLPLPQPLLGGQEGTLLSGTDGTSGGAAAPRRCPWRPGGTFPASDFQPPTSGPTHASDVVSR